MIDSAIALSSQYDRVENWRQSDAVSNQPNITIDNLLLKIMQRPSNLIIAFTLAIASAFLAYAFGRLLFRAIAPPEIDIEEDYESQLYYPENSQRF